MQNQVVSKALTRPDRRTLREAPPRRRHCRADCARRYYHLKLRVVSDPGSQNERKCATSAAAGGRERPRPDKSREISCCKFIEGFYYIDLPHITVCRDCHLHDDRALLCREFCCCWVPDRSTRPSRSQSAASLEWDTYLGRTRSTAPAPATAPSAVINVAISPFATKPPVRRNRTAYRPSFSIA